MLITILALAVVLGVLIFVHELGHFLAAKWAGIWVHRFSIGMGSPIRALSFRRGETEYAISWLPLGGYVKMATREEEGTSALEGETPAEEIPADRMYEAKPVWKRMVVILAGVVMNTLLAWVIFSGLALAVGEVVNPETRVGAVDSALVPAGAEALRTLQAGDRIVAVDGAPVASWTAIELAMQQAAGDRVVLRLEDGRELALDVHADAIEQRLALAAALAPFTPALTGRVLEGRAAAAAGMEPGDTIVAIDGVPTPQWFDVVARVEAAAGQPLAIEVGRAGGRRVLTATPEGQSVAQPDGSMRTVGKIGVEVAPPPARREPYPSVGAALGAGWERTVVAGTTVWRSVKGLASGRVSRRSLGGPIAIGQMAGQTARLGLEPFLTFMAFISINLAVLNLLPIPVLDGGQFLYLVAEAVLRRPLPLAVREKLNLVGLAMILGIMILAFWNDLARVFGAGG